MLYLFLTASDSPHISLICDSRSLMYDVRCFGRILNVTHQKTGYSKQHNISYLHLDVNRSQIAHRLSHIPCDEQGIDLIIWQKEKVHGSLAIENGPSGRLYHYGIVA